MAHLHSIRLRGFKTFARPTELSFEPGVTVIIGPNGSGKSNIADAVLWVLGEQSPGNLRGRSMQDVIFSGPDGKRSSAAAEVSLVFDNNCGSLPLDASQVEVTRRLVRDSASEYRLNGSMCRLLDVQDLFGGLGLGREMHSVISQGKVDAVLNSTPEARRALVEEAAGLGRFKKRRERTRAKLERTRQNLLRVADVEREVKNSLRPLRQQVAAAERFAQATEDWALARARLLLFSLMEVEQGWRDSEAALSSALRRRDEVEQKLAELRRQRAEDEARFSAALREREDVGAVFHRVEAEAERLEARAAGLRQRVARNEGELDRTRRRKELAESQWASLRARAAETGAVTADEGRLLLVTAALARVQSALDEILPAHRASTVREDDLKDEVFELEAARSRSLQDRDFLRREVEEKARLGREVAALVATAQERIRELERQGQELEQRRADGEDALARAREASSSAAARQQEARVQVDQAAREERHLDEALSGLESRQAVLRDLMSRREGTPAGARTLMGRAAGARLLAEVLTVEPGYERALAAALGPVIQAVVVSEDCDAELVLGVQGPLEAVWGSTSACRDDGCESPGDLPPGCRDLWDVVAGPAGLMASLRRLVPPTAVVPVREDRHSEGGPVALATAWQVTSPTRWRLVTSAGEVVVPGVHAARRTEAGAETLMRARNELESVGNEITALTQRRARVAAVAAAALAVLAEADDARHQAEEVLRSAESEALAVKNETDLHERRVAEAVAQRAELEARAEREDDLGAQSALDLARMEQVVALREAELEQARSALRAVQTELEGVRRRVARLEEKKAQATLLEVRLRERCRAHQNERERVKSQLDAAGSEVAALERRLRSLEDYRPLLVRLLECVTALAERARGLSQRLGEAVETARAQSEGAAQVIREWGGAESGLQREHDELASRLALLQVDKARAEDRRTLLGDELVELRRKHLSPRSVSPESLAGETEEALAAALQRAEQRRERIGPVNPLAEQECAEMEERAAFLSEQRRDLEASMTRLQDVIRGLDEHIDTAFGQIFSAAKDNFGQVIATIFPGAKGSLALTDGKDGARGRGSATRDDGDGAVERDVSDDPTEGEAVPGISLSVKFPNKAPRSMSLLSGGEKAMTAIAFLFSLFLARPCPFYILDEVEASLDDVNIRRFLSLIRRYRDKTQFIIITHQRQTMEIADTLYGVALESDGTSRVLSRRLGGRKGEAAGTGAETADGRPEAAGIARLTAKEA